MTNNSPFDDHIKKQLGNYQPEVPSHIWENIIAGKEKKKPGGFLFNINRNRISIILLVLVLSAGGALLIHQNEKSKKTGIATNNKSTSTKTISKQENNILKSKPTEKITVLDKGENNLNNAGKIPAKSAEDVKVKNESAAALLIRNENKNHRRLQQPIYNNEVGAEEKNNKSFLEVVTSTTGKKNINSKNNRGTSRDEDAETAITKSRNKVKLSAAKTRMQVENADADEPVAIQEETTYQDIASLIQHDIFLTKYFLDLHPAEKTFLFSISKLDMPALNIPCPRVEKNAAGNKRYVEIYAGPDYVFRSFNDTANSGYLQKRKSSTQLSSAFSAGIRYTKVFKNAISFRAGINYSQVNETFKYEQGHIVQMVHLIDQNGDTTGSYATTGTRYKTTHNKYRTLDIPITIGYEMGNGRFHTNINAGFVVNMYSWQKGDVLDYTGKPVNITTGKGTSPYQFKTNAGLGFTGAASFYYKITGKLHILAEPYFRYNFSAANKAAITLKQKYTTTGIRLGARLDF